MEQVVIELTPSVEKVLRLGFAVIDRGDSSDELSVSDDPWEESAGAVLESLPVDSVAEERTLRLYRSIGLDPSKDRPSSARLLREAQRGRLPPRLHPLTDGMSLVSLAEQYPVGTYDCSRLSPPIVARLGRCGETVAVDSDRTLGVEGRLVLADADGAFGNPSRDGLRARLTAATRRALVVVWVVQNTPTVVVDRVLQRVAEAAAIFWEGEVDECGIVGYRSS